jgi:hypothetical protein
MKLRFGISNGTLQVARDFVMLISLHFVQIKNLPASFRQLFDGPAQSDTVDGSGEIWVGLAHIPFEGWRVGGDGLIQRKNGRRFAPAQLHEHSVHCNPVEPGGKGGIAAERVNVAKYLQESFLG